MRIAFNIALIFSLLFLPWWAGALIVISACFMIDRFFEAIFYGILADALYGTHIGYHQFAYMATVYTVVVFVISSLIRKRLAW